jgi:succinate-semialdehyde dehydrogenase/glutarate-semialdehyde dehydrogenase
VNTGLFIGGAWRQGTGTLEVTNKYTGEVVGKVSTAGPPEIEAALTSAVRGAEIMSAMPAHQRSTILSKCSSLLTDRRETIARLIATEAGKALKLARAEVECWGRVKDIPTLRRLS